MESIQKFGFKVPIIIDKNHVIIAGHTRHKAAVKLGLEKIPCIIADDLTDEQIKAFRLADNKTGEFATWDTDKLLEELEDLGNLNFDMQDLGFESLMTDIDAFFAPVEDYPQSSPEQPQRTLDNADNAEDDNYIGEQENTPIICPHCGKEIEFE